MRRPNRTVVAAGLLLGLLLAPAPAAAHSFLRDAKPAADATVQRGPKRVALWFNQPIEAEFARITITTRKGRRVHVGRSLPLRDAADALAVRLPRRLPAGRYVVKWRVVSADSHIQSGEFLFRVRRDRGGEAGAGEAEHEPATAAPGGGEDAAADSASGNETTAADGGAIVPDGQHATWLVATARGFTTTGLLLLVGLIVFWLVAWRSPAPALAVPAGVQRAFLRRWQRLAAVALVMTVAATVAGVVMQGAAAAGVPVAAAVRPGIIEGVLATGFGKAAVGRLVLLELLAVVAVLWRLLPLFSTVRPVSAVGAAALQPAVSSRRLMLLMAVVLPLLLTMSMLSHASSASPVGLHLAADVVHLAAAGAWIGGLVKLSMFSGLMVLGAFNHLWAVRRIRAAAAAGAASPALQALRRSVAVETSLAVVIVATTAILVSLPMPAG